MQNNFQSIMDEVFKHEVGHEWKTGGLVDDPKDPGGLTKWGIAQRSHQNLDIRGLDKLDALMIYEREYWKPCRGPDLPTGLDLVAMDGAVNSGPKRSIKWLQRALMVKADGKAGPKTLKAARVAARIPAIKRACANRMGFLQGLLTFTTYGRGWSRRVAEVEAVSVSMAAAEVGLGIAREALLTEAQQASTAAGRQNKATAAPVTAAGGITLTDMPAPMLGALAAMLALAAFILWLKSAHNRNRARAFQQAAIKTGVSQ